ncbi:DUF3784 domain-containing protein [Litoribacter populi]|uniref:DUF3784 domain-containing protein n=1 Tax=Litoribacter populi TaxID=2598460 RepID=UPI0011805CDD|nr:DUF3784 domain-containing protein [Litoribacter populi]
MVSIYTGLIFIAIAILVKFFPTLIAGYNHLSQREKENAISNGLPTFAFTVFSIMGLIVISGHFIALWSDNPSLNNSITILVTLIGTVVLVVFSKRFTYDR